MNYESKSMNLKGSRPLATSFTTNSNDSDTFSSYSVHSQAPPSLSCMTDAIQSSSFSSSNSTRQTGSRNSGSKWNHSSEKAKSVSSLTEDRLSQHGLHHHHHHHCSEKSQLLPETRELVITNTTCPKGVEAMKDEEISSRVFVTRLATTVPREEYCLGRVESQPDYFSGCIIHGGGDHAIACNSACNKQHYTDVQLLSTLKNMHDKSLSNQISVNHMPLAIHNNIASNSLNASVLPKVSEGKVWRPILGASISQNSKMTADDMKVPGADPKISNSIGIPTLPRASSCGVILQHEQDLPSLASMDDNQMHLNFSALQLPSNFAFNMDAVYNNLDSRINFIHLPAFPPFNHQRDSQALPFPAIPLGAVPPPHIDPSLLTPFMNSLPPCTCCSSASLPPFTNYPFWPSHMFFRGNGFVGPRFPQSNLRKCPSGVYVQPFDYISYNSGVVITSPSSVAASSLPPTFVSQSHLPQQLQAPAKSCCQNCGSSTHSVDLCSEPYMLSVGQSAQFKLKTFPKTDSINS